MSPVRLVKVSLTFFLSCGSIAAGAVTIFNAFPHAGGMQLGGAFIVTGGLGLLLSCAMYKAKD